MTAGDPVCRGSSAPFPVPPSCGSVLEAFRRSLRPSLSGSMDNFDRFLPTCVRTSPGKDDQSLPCLLGVPGVRVSRVGPTTAGHLHNQLLTCWVGPFRSQYVDHCPLGGTTVVGIFRRSDHRHPSYAGPGSRWRWSGCSRTHCRLLEATPHYRGY